jgi:type VI secretion system protein ImpH
VTPARGAPAAAPADGGGAAWVERALVGGAHAFDFFQAARLLEQLRPHGLDPLERARPGAGRVAFRPHRGLAFPPADVRAAEPLGADGAGLRLVLNFWGFYGVGSPLPAYFGAAATSPDPEADALRDFLDIFAHRFYHLLYESWKKYRPALAPGEAARARELRRALCVAGLGAPAPPGAVAPERLLPFAGILRTRVRNVEGLLRLVGAVAPDVPAAVRENVPRWVRVTPRPRLGARGELAVLGVTALLGERLPDEAGKFRLVLGPLGWAQFERLRPGREAARAVAEVVGLYAPDHLAYDVELRLRTAELPVTRAGSPHNRLGVTTWLGRPTRDVISEVVEYA